MKEIRLNLSKNIINFNNSEIFIEEFTNFLFSVGAISVSYNWSKLNANLVPEFQEYGESKLCFDVHVPDALNQEKFLLTLLSNYSVNFETNFKQLPEIDWVLLSQSNYEPICVLNKIWIGASWHKKTKIADHSIHKIFIDPGQAFGTGTHPTTKFCLEALIKCSSNFKIKRMLDFGCGSGILSIAACKLGIPSVAAIDNDSSSLKIAKENTYLNDIDINKCLFFSSLKACEGKFDLIISNILFSTLIQLSSPIVKKLKENGILILSGILKSQAASIKKKYLEVSQNTILLNEIATEENWVCLAFFGNH